MMWWDGVVEIFVFFFLGCVLDNELCLLVWCCFGLCVVM